MNNANKIIDDCKRDESKPVWPVPSQTADVTLAIHKDFMTTESTLTPQQQSFYNLSK